MDHAIDLLGMPLGARRDLLRVLGSDSRVRADVVRQLYERGDDAMVEVLAELEADEALCRRVVEAPRRVT